MNPTKFVAGALHSSAVFLPVQLSASVFEEACRNQAENIVDAGKERHQRSNYFERIDEEQTWELERLEMCGGGMKSQKVGDR